MANEPSGLLRRPSLRTSAVEILRARILDGMYELGERLNEARLAEELGTSRGPVREALQLLASEGLVRLVSNKGAFIPSFEADELRELYEVREALEVMAARLAATRRTQRQLDNMIAALADTKRAMLENSQYPADLDFHRMIADMAGNTRLANLDREQHVQLRLARSRSGSDISRAPRAFDEHLAIAEAIKASDPVRAENEMRSHLNRSLENAQHHLCVLGDS